MWRNIILVFHIVWFSWVRATKLKDKNKVIYTSTSVCGSCWTLGISKNRISFRFIEKEIFLTQIWKSVIFYEGIQNLVMDELNARRIQIDFVKIAGFDRLRNIEIFP